MTIFIQCLLAVHGILSILMAVSIFFSGRFRSRECVFDASPLIILGLITLLDVPSVQNWITADWKTVARYLIQTFFMARVFVMIVSIDCLRNELNKLQDGCEAPRSRFSRGWTPAE